MKKNIKKIVSIFQSEGAFRAGKKIIKYIYNNYARAFLPRRKVLYNGVQVQASRLGDQYIPWQQTNRPTYESGIMKSINEFVDSGDDVTIIGGGWGVSCVTAAKVTGRKGHVKVFEGEKNTADIVEETATINNVKKRVDITHAVVGQAISLRGSGDGGKIIPAADLDRCDVLILDCEGAELNILENMNIRPKVLIVETHGVYNAPSQKIKYWLENMGYNINKNIIAEEELRDKCIRNDVYVIVGILPTPNTND